MKVYGPYLRKDSRKHVIIINDDGSRRTVSYPKWLMEQELKRQLSLEETIDHKDNNFNNNDFKNLQILSPQEHGSLDAKRLKPIIKNCSWCGKEFELRKHQKKNNKKAGPFCSRTCTGKYGKHVQISGERLIRQSLEISFYTLKESE